MPKFLITALLAALFLGACSSGPQLDDGPLNLSFDDQNFCETAIGGECSVGSQCDFIPAGKSVEEVCGANYTEGVLPKEFSTVQGENLLVGLLEQCEVKTVDVDRFDLFRFTLKSENVIQAKSVTSAVFEEVEKAESCGTSLTIEDKKIETESVGVPVTPAAKD